MSKERRQHEAEMDAMQGYPDTVRDSSGEIVFTGLKCAKHGLPISQCEKCYNELMASRFKEKAEQGYTL